MRIMQTLVKKVPVNSNALLKRYIVDSNGKSFLMTNKFKKFLFGALKDSTCKLSVT